MPGAHDARTQARAGAASKLHVAAQLGDVSNLRRLRDDEPAVWTKALNRGDRRRNTAFHVACAAGHVECARLLIEAGADTELANDTGLNGWELAAQMKRGEVAALRGTAAAPATRGSKRRQKKVKQPRDAAGAPKQPRHAKHRDRGSSRRTPKAEALAGTAGAPGGSGLEESKALKAALRQRGLSTKGSKQELRDRLAQAGEVQSV